MSQDWDIRPRSVSCQACQTPFTDKQPYYTRLIFQTQGYERGDYCETCWPKAVAQQPRYSAWKGLFRVPPPEPEKTVKKETAETLLRGQLGNEPERHRNTIYILAVMLERQRIFVERDVRQDEAGRPVIVYEHRKTGETFVIPDPQLKLTDLEPVQQEVMAMLGGPAAPATAVTPPRGQTGN